MCTLKLYSDVCQLYLNQTGENERAGELTILKTNFFFGPLPAKIFSMKDLQGA